MYLQHARNIRAKPVYADAQIVLLVENNMTGLEPARIAAAMRASGIRDVLVFDGKPGSGDHGVHTDETAKKDYAETMELVLSTDMLYFVADCDAVSRNWAYQKEKLIKQLNVFRQRKIEPSRPGGEARFVYTGKSHGVPDDSAITAQMTIAWHQKMRTNKKFIREQGR